MTVQGAKLDYNVPQNQAGLLTPDYLASSWCVWRVNPFSYWTVMQLAKLGVFSYITVDDPELRVDKTRYGTLYSNISNPNRFRLIQDILDYWGVKGKGLHYEEYLSDGILSPRENLDAEFHLLTTPDYKLHDQSIKYLRKLYTRVDGLPYDNVGGWIFDVFPISSSVAYVTLFNRRAARLQNQWIWDVMESLIESRRVHLKDNMWPAFPTRLDLPIATAALITSRFINHFMRQGDLPESVRNVQNIVEGSAARIDPLPTIKDPKIELWRVDTVKNKMSRAIITNSNLRMPEELLKRVSISPILRENLHQEIFGAHQQLQQLKMTFFGTGHLGSWIAMMTSLLRIPDITFIDYDKIEHRNIAGAAFRFVDQNKKKTEQLAYVMHDILRQDLHISDSDGLGRTLHGLTPTFRFINRKLTKRTQTKTIASIKKSNVIVVSTDSWNSRYDFTLLLRRLMKTESLGDPCWVIDCRSLERLGQILVVNVRNKKAFNQYTHPLEASSVDTTPLPCDRANVIDLPIHIARFVTSLLWNHQLTGNTLPPASQDSINEYYINPYGYTMVKMT